MSDKRESIHLVGSLGPSSRPWLKPLRTWFRVPSASDDLATALTFSGEVARYMKDQEEKQRDADLEMLLAGCASEEMSNAAPVRPVTAAPESRVTSDEVSTGSTLAENVTVLPITKSSAELESSIEEWKQVQEEASALANDVVSKALRQVEGQNQQLRTLTNEKARFKEQVKELTAKCETLQLQLIAKDVNLDAARAENAALAEDFKKAKGTASILQTQLSSAITREIVGGILAAAIVGLLAWCVVYF